MLSKFFGDKKFYKRVIALALPIMIQNGITNFVNMLDNIMVGRIGTEQMTGVAICNQLFFVFNLCIFGAVSGAGIFTAQYYGSKDHKGVRDTFRFKLILGLVITVIGVLIFYFGGDYLIGLYLRGEGSPESAAASLSFAKEYIIIMLIGFFPNFMAQCYSSTLRETDQTVMPMVAGVSAVFVNLILNYILIFGNFGAPALGVKGAAIATVISRFAELLTVAIYTHLSKKKNPFIVGAYKSFRVPKKLVTGIISKGMPLMLNETMWAAGMAVLAQCYSERGLETVAANNICQTFFDVFSVAFMAVGVSIGIILGQLLGSGEIEEAKRSATRLITFSVMVGIVVGGVYFACAGLIPEFYNTEASVKELAANLMRINAVYMAVDAFAHATYFTLRSGGQTFITFAFDSGFVWAFVVPTAFILSRFTSIGIIPLFAICQMSSILKDIIGYIFVKRGKWATKIVTD
ncbi:MAG: MATE family efflux transporter [Clostridiales bacterium]|nr:MATE family efflux transporter [Candidatus Equinaster intestinalis]